MMKRLYLLLATLLGLVGCQRLAGAPTETTFFVFAKIQDTVGPIERGTKYEDPLDAVLKKTKLGEVTGGGSQLNKEKEIEWIGVDIELVTLTGALALTKKTLRDIGAPKGSVLEYEKDGKKYTLPIHDE